MTLTEKFTPTFKEAANDNKIEKGFHIPWMEVITGATTNALNKLSAANDNFEIKSPEVNEYKQSVETNIAHIVLDEDGWKAQAA